MVAETIRMTAFSVPGTFGHLYNDVCEWQLRRRFDTLPFNERRRNVPRHSPYEIVLTRKEREALEAVVRKYTARYCDVMRAKIALLAADGLDNKRIGARLDLPRQIVSKWRKRFFEERLAGLAERPRRGRPRTFST